MSELSVMLLYYSVSTVGSRILLQDFTIGMSCVHIQNDVVLSVIVMQKTREMVIKLFPSILRMEAPLFAVFWKSDLAACASSSVKQVHEIPWTSNVYCMIYLVSVTLP